jgi:hypothetical protein
MAIAAASASVRSFAALIANLRACSLEDSILDRMLDSRELGRKTLPMAYHLLYVIKLNFIVKILRHNNDMLNGMQEKKSMGSGFRGSGFKGSLFTVQGYLYLAGFVRRIADI